MTWLEKEVMETATTISPGSTIKTFHCKTGRGNDRLYLTRTEDGKTVLGFCHHCGAKGRLTVGLRDRIASRHLPKKTRGPLVLPHDCTPKLHLLAEVWLRKYGITEIDQAEHGIVWSDSLDRLVFPIFRNGKLTSYHARGVKGEQPKWLAAGDKTYGKHVHHWPSDPTVVIVEDYLSAIKVGKTTNAYALMGVHLSDEAMLELLASNYTRWAIWLDNDNRQVKRRQLVLKNRLSNYGECAIIHTNHDPKEHEEREIGITIAESFIHKGTPH